MKRINTFLLAATLGLVNSSQAQIGLTMNVQNGQMSAGVNTAMTGLTPGVRTVRIIKVSDNVSLSPVVGAVIDTFTPMTTHATGTDTIRISVPYPGLYYVSDSIYQDSIGIISSAIAINDSGVILTPDFLMPTESIVHQSVDTMNAYFNGTFSSGYDVAVMRVVVSFGDTLFANPADIIPAVIDTLLPVLGTTVQTVHDSVKIPIGASNYPFSYRVYISNSKGTDSSVIYKGRTRAMGTTAVLDPFAGSVIFEGTIKVYALNGQIVYSGHVADVATMKNVSDNVSVPGIYILCATTDAGVQIAPKKVGIQ